MNSPSVLERSSSLSTIPEAQETFAVERAVLAGLSAKSKYLPSWLFYDAAGSRLFEAITRLPEYYLTVRESRIFERYGREIIAAATGSGDEEMSVVELGAGSANKTIILLRALISAQGHAIYMPVDVSPAALQWAGRNVRASLPSIQVQPICSDITHEKPLHLPTEGRRLALYIGSSIGNFDPDEAVDLLAWLRSQLQPGDALLLGTDMVKDEAPLLAAYNDAAGVTAEFNKNILARLNRELGANFALDAFDHRAIWNADASRIEMHLDSQCNQFVRVEALDRCFTFRAGESIHTENSYKFLHESVEDMLQDSGFVLEKSWYDDDRWFGVHLARAVDDTSAIADDEEEAA